MAVREDGEFELVLGNKQLFSVLFIIVVLLGVFFAMGFLVGRSTGPTQVASGEKPPLVVEGAGKSGSAASKEPEKIQYVDSAGNQLPTGQIPAKKSTSPAATTAEPSPPVATKAPTPPSPAPAAPPSGFIATPPAGMYLQVAATRKAEAESMLALLGKNGLKGYVTPSTKSPELMRVVIGPLPNNEAMASARSTLLQIGIDKPVPIKY